MVFAIPYATEGLALDVIRGQTAISGIWFGLLAGRLATLMLRGNLDGRVLIAKMNIDDNPMTPQKYGVRGIPTLMLFRDGQVAATKVGALAKRQLQDWVESVL